MQSFTEVTDAHKLLESKNFLLNNDKTALSCSSGTAFPTADLQVGMLCYRTDLSQLYQLKDAAPTWKLIFDLAKTATNQEAVDLKVSKAGDAMTGHLEVASNIGAAPINIWDNAQVEAVCYDGGVAAISLHRSGYSHVGIMHRGTNELTVNMNSGEHELHHAGNGRHAKASVNFNGTGVVAIRSSFNVSSITDNATGDYRVNFTTAMPNADYVLTGTASISDATNDVNQGVIAPSRNGYANSNNASWARVHTTYRLAPAATWYDMGYVSVAVLHY